MTQRTIPKDDTTLVDRLSTTKQHYNVEILLQMPVQPLMHINLHI